MYHTRIGDPVTAVLGERVKVWTVLGDDPRTFAMVKLGTAASLGWVLTPAQAHILAGELISAAQACEAARHGTALPSA